MKPIKPFALEEAPALLTILFWAVVVAAGTYLVMHTYTGDRCYVSGITYDVVCEGER